jgi:hypothetical protein
MPRLYTGPAIRLDFLFRHSHLPVIARPAPHVAAKMRRIRRELSFHAGSHDEWPRSKWREGPGSDHELRDFPQTPMILGDKWDS